MQFLHAEGFLYAFSTLVLTFSALALVGVGLATSPVVTTVEAQARAVSRMRFQEMDRNNDGVITRQEWNGSAHSFNVHDWNGDGRLSGDEVRIGGAAQCRNSEVVDHNPGRYERNLELDAQPVSPVSITIVTAASPATNGTSTSRRSGASIAIATTRSTCAEFLGEGDDDDRDDNFDDLDFNNNGRVERTEWHGGATMFRVLDQNNDGVLSRFEVVGSTDQPRHLRRVRGPRLRPQRHRSSRRNGSGRTLSFTQRDTNRDGRHLASASSTLGRRAG